MGYTLKYEGGEKREASAHGTGVQLKYLRRDLDGPIQIIDPEGNEITLEELGERALDELRAR